MGKESQHCDVANLEKGSCLVKEMAENPLFSGVKDILEAVGRAVDDVLQRRKADADSDRDVEDAPQGTDEGEGSGGCSVAKKASYAAKPRVDPNPECFVIYAARPAGLGFPEMRFSRPVSEILVRLYESGRGSSKSIRGIKLPDRKAFAIIGSLLEFREERGGEYMSDAEIAEKSSYSMDTKIFGRISWLLEGSGLIVESGGSKGWKIMDWPVKR